MPTSTCTSNFVIGTVDAGKNIYTVQYYPPLQEPRMGGLEHVPCAYGDRPELSHPEQEPMNPEA